MPLPLLPIAFGVVGVAATVRGAFRPYRAVLKEGTVDRCSGRTQLGLCDSTDQIKSPKGTPAYALAPGVVAAAGETFVQLVASNEPVILMYSGITPEVVEGQHVGRGQTLGKSLGAVAFGVWQLKRVTLTNGQEAVQMQRVPPSAWLAARGMKHVVKDLGAGEKWCEGGRHITVPRDAKTACDLKQPYGASFGLLPVEINMS